MRMDGDSDESPPSVLEKESQIASMGWESAKELDDAVTILTAPEHPFVTMSVKFRCRLCTKRAVARGDAVRSPDIPPVGRNTTGTASEGIYDSWPSPLRLARRTEQWRTFEEKGIFPH
jgi:hypothetical protein